jgi:hypothetical protein
MTTGRLTLTIEVRLAWWLWPYLGALFLFCRLTAGAPDEAKLAKVIGRAMRVRVV